MQGGKTRNGYYQNCCVSDSSYLQTVPYSTEAIPLCNNNCTIYIVYTVSKILSTPSFGWEVKQSVPCRRFSACKRSLNFGGSRNLGKITGHISRPQFHLSLLGSLASLRTYRHLAAKVGTSKGGGKQWQTTPKNLPRMQCARAIPVTGLGSGSSQSEL